MSSLSNPDAVLCVHMGIQGGAGDGIFLAERRIIEVTFCRAMKSSVIIESSLQSTSTFSSIIKQAVRVSPRLVIRE